MLHTAGVRHSLFADYALGGPARRGTPDPDRVDTRLHKASFLVVAADNDWIQERLFCRRDGLVGYAAGHRGR
jgi:hypothetical protein